MRHSPTTLLPSSWITQDPTLRYYDKLVWYQRAFTVRRRQDGRAFLRFGAVDYVAYVYLNGHFVGRHEGGFTPFAFEVTELLRDGENRITIGADAERSAETVPPTVTDWETYGGVTRPVLLIQTPRTYVDDAWLRLTRDGRIAATVRLDGPDAAGRPVRVEIAALHFVMTGTTGADGSWTATRAGAARPAPLVARKPHPLRRPLRRRRGRAARPDRPAHDRGARRGHPAQRPSDLPARHLPARGGTGRESEPDDHRPPPPAPCSPRRATASTPISSASPIIRTAR